MPSSSTTTVSVSLRGSLASQLHTPRVTVDVPMQSGLTAQAVRKAVANRHPEARALVDSALLVAGERILSSDDTVPIGASLALVPPVSGG